MNKITEEFVKEKIGKRCLNTHKGDSVSYTHLTLPTNSRV